MSKRKVTTHRDHQQATTTRAKSSGTDDTPEVKFGDVGYIFVKHFPGYGYFRGTVVQIRPHAEYRKSRRCRYTDGDEEDLSLKQLRALENAEKKRQNDKQNLVQREKPYNAEKREKKEESNKTKSAFLKSDGINSSHEEKRMKGNDGSFNKNGASLEGISTRNVVEMTAKKNYTQRGTIKNRGRPKKNTDSYTNNVTQNKHSRMNANTCINKKNGIINIITTRNKATLSGMRLDSIGDKAPVQINNSGTSTTKTPASKNATTATQKSKSNLLITIDYNDLPCKTTISISGDCEVVKSHPISSGAKRNSGRCSLEKTTAAKKKTKILKEKETKPSNGESQSGNPLQIAVEKNDNEEDLIKNVNSISVEKQSSPDSSTVSMHSTNAIGKPCKNIGHVPSTKSSSGVDMNRHTAITERRTMKPHVHNNHKRMTVFGTSQGPVYNDPDRSSKRILPQCNLVDLTSDRVVSQSLEPDETTYNKTVVQNDQDDGENIAKAKNKAKVFGAGRSSKKRKRHAEDIGKVGYVFTKMFPGHGLFNGMVVDILPGSGTNALNRRCVFTDGDSEDLSLSDLKKLAQLYPRNMTIELAKRQDKEVKSANLAKSRLEKRDTASHNYVKSFDDHPDNIREQVDLIYDWTTLDEAEEFEKASELLPPIDTAAEATIDVCGDKVSKKRKTKKKDISALHEDWLEEVATGLLKSTKSSRSSKKKVTSQREEVKQIACVTRNKPLLDVKNGERFGCKVINLKLSQGGRCVVGEVILEHKFGWIEVIEGENVRKGRVGDYFLVSDDYKIGEELLVSDECITDNATSSEVSVLSAVDNSPTPAVSCSTSEPRTTLASLFYWQCDECTHKNIFIDRTCTKCCTKRNERSIPSALLKLTEEATESADSLEEARNNIAEAHRGCIPHDVLYECFHKTNSPKIRSTMQNPRPIGKFFYWNCGFCTMQNSYKVYTCKCCSQKKNELADSSILLKIASDAATSSVSEDEAMKKIHPLHTLAMPVGIMSTLVTCTASISKDKNRRCLRARIPGSDYCTFHKNPFSISKTGCVEIPSSKAKDDNGNSPQKHKNARIFKTVAQLKDDVRDFFKKISPNASNNLKWDIQCIEDAYLSERNVPFALGLLVRRYFPGYGFHDGRIKNIERKTVSETGQERPVLLYRVEYNDGDREDLLHHEINSLRQLYNPNVVNATASPNDQIPYGSKYETLLGVVEIKGIEAKISNRADNGNVYAYFRKNDQTTWASVNLELTKLQLTIIRKVCNNNLDNLQCSSSAQNQLLPSPALEWPNCPMKKTDSRKKEVDKEDKKVIISDPAMYISEQPLSFDDSEEDAHLIPLSQQCLSKRPIHQNGWDPVGARDYLAFDPFDQTICEMCKNGDKDHSILICDECNLGYHTFCLRPVVSTIPTTEWICPSCSSQETGREGFKILVEELLLNFPKVATFLKLPFASNAEMTDCFKDIYDFLSSSLPKSQRFAAFGYGKKKTLTAQIGKVHVNRKVCKHLWLLPTPQLNPRRYCHTFATMVAAFKYCGVEQYSEQLVYGEGLSEDYNDASLDNIQKMSKDNSSMFRLYKENLKNGVYPPVEVVYDDELGFTVRALAPLPRHTILTEYIGEVTTIEKCNETSSDSLMILLETGDPKTSLIIDPTKISNIARFLSGVNNRSLESRRKANVRTRRFALDGKSRVALFTSRNINAGESLNYDYNAGKEGKSLSDILNMGFYDTSNFL